MGQSHTRSDPQSTQIVTVLSEKFHSVFCSAIDVPFSLRLPLRPPNRSLGLFSEHFCRSRHNFPFSFTLSMRNFILFALLLFLGPNFPSLAHNQAAVVRGAGRNIRENVLLNLLFRESETEAAAETDRWSDKREQKRTFSSCHKFGIKRRGRGKNEVELKRLSECKEYEEYRTV